MGISIYSNNGIKAYGIKHYILDYESDVQKLPTNITPGSTAFIGENSKTYMINTQKKWIEINLNNGSIINNSSDNGDILIYNGGVPGGEW